MARRKAKHHGEEEASEAWLLPYSDLMTLLLAVFIVLFAVSKVDEVKLKAMSDAFRGIFDAGGSSIIGGGNGILDDGTGIVPDFPATTQPSSSGGNIDDAFSQGDLQGLETLQEELQTYFMHVDLQDVISTTIDERGLIISLTNSILFDSGSVEIKPEYMEVLTNIGISISKLDNYIRVEGHTDNIPISTAAYPSNWELSGARAASVVRLFVDEADISPDRLVSVGYSEYRPIADNGSAEGRAQNRRVDIIVLNMNYDTLERDR